ncbi:MAG TPA: hypothetical protein VJI96_03355 [Candidatus Andersenbacteria bacterium]|nr:hypothetical protein [Candidatus Andersenbacteria bacterium]
METRKIAVACFIGGVLCYAVAALFAPAYAWLGVFAGLAGGYLSYEFREVLLAIPIAWNATCGRTRNTIIVLLRKRLAFNAWAKERQALVYPLAVFWWILFLCIFLVFMSVSSSVDHSVLLYFLIGAATGFMMATLLSLLIVMLIAIGANEEKCFWQPFMEPEKQPGDWAKREDELWQQGLNPVPLTYANVYRWLVKGALHEFRKPIAHVVSWSSNTLRSAMKFTWYFFTLIHSHKRVLCAIDGTIGGVVSFFCFYSQSATAAEHIIPAIFGGLIGAMLGVLNWELISVRLLKVNVAK